MYISNMGLYGVYACCNLIYGHSRLIVMIIKRCVICELLNFMTLSLILSYIVLIRRNGNFPVVIKGSKTETTNHI